ncbi:MAG: disulfide bond formation protein DsbA [Parcubacteria group bacterium]|nr:MAG: disulfide bond formation protein DsbA [Parcubacteria group bacterium]
MNSATKKQIRFWVLTTVGLTVLVLIILGFAYANNNNPSVITLTANDWIQGNPEAKTTLVQYSDFQCPACVQFQQYFKTKIEPTLSNKVRVVYRNYPLTSIHPRALLAAQAAEAAGLQGKFWEMHDQLFADQSAWVGAMDPQILFEQYATTLGLNLVRFKADMTSDTVKNAIAEDIASGDKAGIEGTPSFFINGKKVTLKNSYDELKQLIDKSVAAQ